MASDGAYETPTVEAAFTHSRYVAAFVICSVAFALTFAQWLQWVLRLRAASGKIRQHSLARSYFAILLMPPVYCLCALLASVFLDQVVVFDGIKHVLEAVALWRFFMVVVTLGLGETELVKAIDSHVGVRNQWLTPPFGCLLFWCPKRRFTASLMRAVKYGTRQFTVVVPLFCIAEIMAHNEWSLDQDRLEVIVGVLDMAKAASTVIALQCLFVLYKRSHDVLHAYATTRKFVAIKLFIILSLLQTALIQFLVSSGVVTGDDTFGPLVAGGLWANVCLAVECPLLAWFAARAYPASDLDGKMELHELPTPVATPAATSGGDAQGARVGVADGGGGATGGGRTDSASASGTPSGDDNRA